MKAIQKAVFPVAGLGTRFLPATKANPKEMLPIVDKPLIQYAVEEAIAAGITEIIFVTSSSKRAIEDHFDKNYELEARLEVAGKLELLKVATSILPSHINCIYIRQPEPKGLGDAVLCAKNIVADEPFAVLLADDLMLTKEENCLQQMVNQFQQQQSSIVAVERVTKENVKKYGVVDVPEISERLKNMKAIVEKPNPENAPSNLAVAGRYIFTPKIFQLLEKVKPGQGNEIQLTDAISSLIDIEKVFAYEFAGQRYDCGTKLGYLKATIAQALKHDELRDGFKAYLQALAEKSFSDSI